MPIYTQPVMSSAGNILERFSKDSREILERCRRGAGAVPARCRHGAGKFPARSRQVSCAVPEIYLDTDSYDFRR